MSQPSAASVDPSLTDQDLFTQAQLDQLFNTVGYDPNAYIQTSPQTAIRFGLQQYYTSPSVAANPVQTPDFFNYNFDHFATGYPTPGQNTPHPYPVEQQQCLDSRQDVCLAFRQRPQPVRSHTNTPCLQPSHPTPDYTRRRSLSQSAIDHTAPVNTQASNPVFMRLQAPRARSESPGTHANKRRAGHHSRSTSQDTSSRGHHTREQAPTSMPHHVNGLVPTHIGDPLSPDSPRFHHSAAQQQWPSQDGLVGGIVFRHMAPEQMEQSRKIIEIGAISVQQHVDPVLEQSGPTMLRKIEEVERYLKAECGECDGALRGCATIREALARKEDGSPTSHESDASRNTLDAPSNIMSKLDDDFFGDGGDEANDDVLMNMLMQENATPFTKEHV
ncbi:hypothetical protein E8E12_010055 [Didymella heteroderae]|uniref:Uncharacterized protein n=1 Tax=Didymella heteroderae TaxID=1769908 RepID=A0A9P5C4R6_9PLEO|nr:hypothetical protein E8E12_010055 [Didymella heteroderae]